MTTDEFKKITHTLSDKELNRIIYQNARDSKARNPLALSNLNKYSPSDK